MAFGRRRPAGTGAMTRNRKAAIIGIISLLAIGVYALTSTSSKVAEQSGSEPDEYVTLTSSLDELISDFNAAAGSVRMVFVVGPSCGPCLRGLDDMNRVVGDMTRDDANLKAFVLYVPTLRANADHAARAVRLMKGADIHHYWDPAGETGFALQKAMELPVYAWDVWLVYDGDAVWEKDNLSAPVYWEHQLGGLPRDQHLDPKRFAKNVVAILDKDKYDE